MHKLRKFPIFELLPIAYLHSLSITISTLFGHGELTIDAINRSYIQNSFLKNESQKAWMPYSNQIPICKKNL
jgi:hypothetical protein